MAQNYFLIGSLVLGVIALIMFFASWFVSRKVTLSDSDRKNANNLLIAGMVFLALALISGVVSIFKPSLCTKYVAPATMASSVPMTTIPSAYSARV